MVKEGAGICLLNCFRVLKFLSITLFTQSEGCLFCMEVV